MTLMEAFGGLSGVQPLRDNINIEISMMRVPTIKRVIFNSPATIIFWDDGTKTIVKAQSGDSFDKEKGLAMAISKKALGNKGNFNEVFKKWCDE